MPLWRIIPRQIRRSIGRIVTHEERWNGNRENLSALVGRDSVVGWAVRSHRTHATELPDKLAKLRDEGITTPTAYGQLFATCMSSEPGT